MKSLKLLFAFLLFAGVASCGSDDDNTTNGPSEDDRIVGEWKLQSLTLDGEEWELTDCDLRSRLRFSSNGDILNTNFFEDLDSEECIPEVTNEEWVYLGNNVYKITDEDGTQDVTIVFSNNDNAFTITEENEDGTYTATYVRV